MFEAEAQKIIAKAVQDIMALASKGIGTTVLTGPLAAWKLTLPVNDNGQLSGSPLEIMPEKLVAGYSSEWFKQEGNVITFRVPLDGTGAKTPNATNTRCELRGLKEFKFNENYIGETTFFWKNPVENVKMVGHQLHDGDAPIVKSVFSWMAKGGMTWRALVKIEDGTEIDTEEVLLSNIPNTPIYEKYDYNGEKQVLTITATPKDGKPVTKQVSLARTGAGGVIYEKKGAYPALKAPFLPSGTIAEITHTLPLAA